MKWLASPGGPRIDWACAVTKRIATAAARSSAMRIVCMIRIVYATRRRSKMRIFMRGLGRIVVLTAGLVAVGVGVWGQGRPPRVALRLARPYTTWTAYSGGAHSSQYSALNQINKSNVSQLQVVWTFPVTGTVIFNPLVVDGVMYLQASGNTLAAVNAASGKEIWRRQVQGPIG